MAFSARWGWKRWQVLALIESEAMTLGLGGSLIGIACGWLGLHLLAKLPQTASIVSSHVSPLLLGETLLIGIFAGLLAGAGPAWRGAQLTPVEALRYD